MSLPSGADVIYMDFNPEDTSLTQSRSASGNFVTTGLTVSDAVGALPIENSQLYVINTGELQTSNNHNVDPRLALRDYRERLDITRRILDHDNYSQVTPHLRENENTINRK
ncbi:hypothetical protein FRC12_013021 [Ceratobasidium sp. 428]|nr:hypothetical protein FRC12_013021 [Ceratobasidium sp. 428]